MKNYTNHFRKLKGERHKFASLTAYDYPMGRLLDELELDFLLVGDSLGMVVLGHPDTTSVTLEIMQHHTAAVARGVTRTLLVSDLSVGTTNSPEQAVENAKSLMRAGAKAVKLEGGRDKLPEIKAIQFAGIPVLGHIGMLPQKVREEGGYRIKGKTPQQADEILQDALALDEAGVLGIVLELVSPPLAREISQKIKSPTIVIGSGDGCDGQILVTHDLLGLFPWFTPRFVQPKAALAPQIQSAVREYIQEIRGKVESMPPSA
ncbi:MAG: 3-methyl-2-oxobutanoate hydroxymethyltransferase [Chthoniobacterales bacterium]